LSRLGVAGVVAIVAAVVVAAGCSRDEPAPPPSADSAEAAPPRPRATDNPHFARALDEVRADRLWAGLWWMTLTLRDEPSHHGALSGLGVYAYRQGRWEDVPGYLEALAIVRPLVRDELLALADASLKLNHFAKAESLFVAFGRRRPAETGVLVAQGTARRGQGKLELAAADFRRALEIDPALDEARFTLAEILLDSNRPEEAWVALGRTPGDGPGPARLHLLRARVLLQQASREDVGGDYRGPAVGPTKKGIQELERCLEVEPANVDALYLLVGARRRLGDLEAARDAARRHGEARAALDDRGPALAAKALVQGAIAIESGDTTAALAAWEKGLEDDPDDASLRCVLANDEVPGPLFLATGRELRRLGLPRVAIDQFEVAASRMPESEEAIYFLALANSETGDWEAAIAAAAPFE
jgi:tetratricopeptide (TPR) repeat protein